MIKNFNSQLIDNIANEIIKGKDPNQKLIEIGAFTEQFLNNQLTNRIIKHNMKHVVMLVDYFNDAAFGEDILREKGYFVNSFVSSVPAEHRIRAHKPDIVIIDVLSNKFDGWQVACNTKKLYPNTQCVGIIHPRQIQMIELGQFSEVFDFFLILPLSKETLTLFPPVKRETSKERLQKKVRLVQAINRFKLTPSHT